MANRKRTVELEVVADTRKATAGLKRVGDDAGKTGGRFKDAGSMIKLAMGATATTAVLGFANDAINAYSELEQSVGGTEAVFGDSAAAVEDMAARSADALGLSEAEFRTATTSIGGQLKRMTGDVEYAAEQSVVLTGVAADLAATYGGTTAEAVAALGSAFRGEADPAERFNLNLKIGAQNAKAVELGLADTTSEVDDNARAQATLALIMEQSADAQGQFAREADTVAGKLQRQGAAAKDASAAMGAWLAPFKMELAEVANDIITIGDNVAKIGGDNKGFGDLVGAFFDWAPILGDGKRFLEGLSDLLAGEATESADQYAVSTAAMTDHAESLNEELDILHGATRNVKEEQAKAVPSAEALARALEHEAEMAREARVAQEERRAALRALHDPISAVINSNRRLVEIEEELRELEEAGKTNSEEYVDLALEKAGVNADLQQTLADLKSQGIDPTGAAARLMFEDWGLTDAQIDKIFAQFDEIEANAPQVRIGLLVPTGRYDVDGNDVRFNPGPVRQYHSGGVVGGRMGSEQLALLQAGERVTPRGGAGDGGGDIVIQIDGREIARAVRDHDRRYR